MSTVQSIHCFTDLEFPREEHNICISPPSVEFDMQMSKLAECVKPQPGSQLPGDHTSDSSTGVEHPALIKQVTATLVCSGTSAHPWDAAQKDPTLRETKSFQFTGTTDTLAPWIQLWFAELMELCTSCSLFKDKWMQDVFTYTRAQGT